MEEFGKKSLCNECARQDCKGDALRTYSKDGELKSIKFLPCPGYLKEDSRRYSLLEVVANGEKPWADAVGTLLKRCHLFFKETKNPPYFKLSPMR